ncbi:MAG TPA: FG-GAP repeat protein, partial [Solirubrobacteraceae bacterium]|nr:FG-GAP repeat protein [Solirubrobacteraceae bacterium]
MGRDGTPGAIALRGVVPGPKLASRRSGRLRLGLVGGPVAAAAALGCAAALVVLPGAHPGRHAAARHGLGSLPVAAQGPVSAALGRDEPAYRVRGLRAVNPAQRLRVGFTGRGATVASGGARLGMTLSAYGYASALAPAPAVTPRASANRVSYTDGSLTEWFANGPLGLEQGFDVAARPSAGGGPLTFSLAISGNLASRLQDGSLLLSGRGVALRYGGLVATDARGRVLHSWLQLAGGHVLIRVDDRGALYPLRIDPLVQQAELTASDGAEEDELGTSVAVSGNTIVVGAPNRTVVHEAQGAAYVFVKPSSGWATAT